MGGMHAQIVRVNIKLTKLMRRELWEVRCSHSKTLSGHGWHGLYEDIMRVARSKVNTTSTGYQRGLDGFLSHYSFLYTMWDNSIATVFATHPGIQEVVKGNRNKWLTRHFPPEANLSDEVHEALVQYGRFGAMVRFFEIHLLLKDAEDPKSKKTPSIPLLPYNGEVCGANIQQQCLDTPHTHNITTHS